MRILHEETPFTEEEKQQKINEIHRNIRDSMHTILAAMPTLDPPLEADAPENAAKREWFLAQCQKPDDQFEYTEQFYDYAQALWNDKGVQECFARSNEYQLIDCAKYFLDRVEVVRKPDFSPSEQDILRARVLTSGIFETKVQNRFRKH